MTRSTYHTSMAATLAVGAELSRAGYDVAFTLGNIPRIDLLCAVPDGQPFKIQVKGISSANAFWVQQAFFDADPQQDLFLVIVLVPPPPDPPLPDKSRLRFFVLSHSEAKHEFSKMPKIKRDRTPYTKESSGLNWGSITQYEDKWDKLPPITGTMQPNRRAASGPRAGAAAG